MLKKLLDALFGLSNQRASAAHFEPRTPKAIKRDYSRVSETAAVSKQPTARTIKGMCYVIDGDTIVISGTKIRIAGIDAPELEHPWGKKSKFALISMCKGKLVTAVIREEISYDRIVAKCLLPDGTDVAAELVKQGLALDWPKFSGGEYTHLEPHDARRRLWRAAARQKGHMNAFRSEVKPRRNQD